MTYQLTDNCADDFRCANEPTLIQRLVKKVGSFTATKIARYRKNRQDRISREAFRQMLLLDNEILDDIGVTRENVEWASQLPMHYSAAKALESTKKRARPKQRP